VSGALGFVLLGFGQEGLLGRDEMVIRFHDNLKPSFHRLTAVTTRIVKSCSLKVKGEEKRDVT
jgi:hypothetical protein